MLNEVQSRILQLNNLDLTATKEELINNFISLLELRTGEEFVRDKNSNIYILTEVFVEGLLNYKLNYLEFISNLNSFFDTNKFTGYAGGDYYGLRSAILNLNFFKDCKIAVVKEGIVNIIVLLNDGIEINKIKQEVAKFQ